MARVNRLGGIGPLCVDPFGMKSAAGRSGMGAVMGSKQSQGGVQSEGTLDIDSKPDEYRHNSGPRTGSHETRLQASGETGALPCSSCARNALGSGVCANNQAATIGDKGPLLQLAALQTHSTGDHRVKLWMSRGHRRHRVSVEKGYRGK